MQQTGLEKVSMGQLTILLITFEIGSAILVGVATGAKQDAWLAVCIATLAALALVTVYTSLIRSGAGKNLYEIMEQQLTRKAAIVITLGYVGYFMYIAARIMRDLIELLATSVYPATPNEFIAFTFILVIAYILYLGLESFARTAEILMPYVAMFFAMMLLLLIVNGSIYTSNLLPVLSDGLAPVIKEAFPKVVTFPFGELIALTVIMAQADKPEKLRKTVWIGVGISGFLLAFVAFLQVTVLTPERVGRTTFPLLSVNRNINVGYLFERLDGIVVFLMLIGIFIKVTVFFYAALKGMEFMAKRPYRLFVVPSAILIALTSLMTASDYMEHLKEGLETVPAFLHIPFQLAFPFILWLIVVIRGQKNKPKPSGGG
jgi:spore germination protein KB